MPVQTRVLPRLNLALFVYSGRVTLAESLDAVASVARHHGHHDTMRQLCDLSAVTGVERNFPDLMKTQARMADDLMPRHGERFVVFYAPHGPAQTLAEMARKSWDGIDAVLVRVVEREEQALALLGLRQSSMASLLALGT